MKNTLYKAINATTGAVIADRVRIAEDYKSRSVGLLSRRNFEKGEGLLIRPCNSIHTFFMRFPIDVVFLDKNGVVLKIKHSLQPWRFSACVPFGYMTLELPENTIEKSNICFKNVIKFEKIL